MVARFLAVADRQPGAIAVEFQGRRLAYGELEAATRQLAQQLRRIGVRRGDIVALWLPQGIEAIVAMLGALRAGAAYLPIDLQTPAARVHGMLEDARPPVIITCSARLADLAATAGTTPQPFALLLEAGQSDFGPSTDDAALPLPTGQDLAYVIFTSGSTGRPKGVLIEHGGLINNLAWQLDTFGFNPSDRILLWTTLAFDAVVWEIWTPLVAGATIVIADRASAQDPRETLRMIERESISFAQTVPSFLTEMLAEYETRPLALSLRLFAVGGEPLTPATARRWLTLTGVDLLNMYGPTECTVDATWRRLTPADRERPITIGRPIANTEAWVLDDALQPVADGVPGELYLASVGLARGYLNRPELTAERFIANPFGHWPSDRLYRTGDVVRRQADGELAYLGRSDDQVKIRGQRIELGEIEAALQALPGVGEAIALVVRGSDDQPRLLAAVRVISATITLDRAELRQALGRSLSTAMLPDAIHLVDDFPRLLSGKIDRKALARDLATDAGSARPAASTRAVSASEAISPSEAIVATHFAAALGLAAVGRNEDFFALGGHSIGAARLAARLRAELGRECSTALVLAEPTVARLAVALDQAALLDQSESVVQTASPDRAASVDEQPSAPATAGQAGLWFLERMNGPSARHHIIEAWVFDGPLDSDRLRSALQTLVDRHDVLRSGFIERDGEPWLKVSTAVTVPFDSQSSAEAELDTRIRAFASAPFELERPPLLRARLLRTGAQASLLVVVVHHLVADGWSLDLFEQELAAAYHGRPLATPGAFLPHARRLASATLQQRQQDDLDWWQSQLGDLQPPTFDTEVRPTDRAPAAGEPPAAEDNTDSIAIELPAGSRTAVAQLAAREGFTGFTVLAAALSVLLARETGRSDIAFVTPTDGRDDLASQSAFGYFVRLLPLRMALDDAPSFETATRRMHARLLAARAHDQVGWEQIVARLALRHASAPRNGEGPIPICITYNAQPALPDWEGIAISRRPMAAAGSRFDLAIDIHASDEATRIVFEGRSCVLDRGRLQRLAEQFQALLLVMLHAPASAVPVLATRPAAAAVPTRPMSTDAWPVAAVAGNAGAPIDVAVTGTLTETVRRIWQSVLARNDLALNEDFFSAGGHSLLAARVAARIRAETGVDLPLRVLFDHPTIAGQAAWLRQQGAVDTLAETVVGPATAAVPSGLRAASPIDRAASLPLTDIQSGIWFIDKLRGPSGRYNLPDVFRIDGPIDVDRLHRAVQALVDRHEILRTRYFEQDGVPKARIEAAVRIDLPVFQTQEADLDGVLATLIDEPFDLRTAPLIRARLLRLAPQAHVLVIVLHHIAADGWSLELLEQELARAMATGESPSGDDDQPRLQFADYVDWLGSAQRQQQAEVDLAWWTAHLADLQPLDPRGLLSSALAAPQPLPDPDEAGVLQIRFPAPLGARLRAFARGRSTTPFMVIATVLKTLLMRVSGQSDIALLTPSAARPLEAFEGLLGCFLNLLVLRTDLGGAPSVATLLERVRETVAEASQHGAAGYDRITAAINNHGMQARPGSPGATGRHGEGPVQIYLNLDMDVEESLLLGPAQAHRVRPDARQARFDLAFDFDLTESDFSCTIEYRRSRLAAQAVDRMAAMLTTLFEHALEHPEAPITRLALADPAEHAAQLHDWNATRRSYPDQIGVHRLILERAAVHPEALALVCGEEQWTYRQLRTAATRLAWQLQQRGASPGRFIGICLDRGPDMIVAMLATMMSGAAWVPLDPAYPVERLEMMAEDASLLLVISTKDQVNRLGAHPPPLLLLDDVHRDDSPDASPLTATATFGAGPADPAYMIYTSGSTGRPKGVCIPHRALANFLASMADKPGLSASDQVLALTTLSFDISLLETLLPLVVGASVRIATRAESSDGARLRSLVEQTPVSLLQATPATWRMLLDTGWAGKPAMKALVGGEALTAALARELQPRCRELWNMYGPTETTVWSTCEQIQRDAAGITIGRPIANTLIHIVDSHDQACAVGIAGEILIGGAGLAIGYHERPELNRERFVTLPHPTGTDVRFYRTGDLGRWVGDGRVEHLGRIDHQIKLRGHRIELGEIEHQIAEHPAVRQAVAAVREPRPGDHRLVAFIVPTGDERLPAGLRQWREFLSRQLPDYMLPQHIQVLDSLPLLPNGKVDRARLPMPTAPERESDAVPVEAPRGDTEAVLAALWAEVLGIKTVGRDEDFFDLGGHSLLALRLLHRVEVQFGTTLRLASLFEAPTIARMAQLIDAGEAASDQGCAVLVSQGQGCPPLFFVSGWGGALLTFNRLGEELGPHQPLVVLDTSVFDGSSGTLAQIATRMIRDMRRLQPAGPYQLCGFSQGGKFVHEIACQLREAGEAVHLLAFLDCTGPDYPRKRSLVGRLVRHASNVLRQDWRTNLDYLTVRLGYFTRIALRTEDRLFVGRDSDVADSEVGRRMQEAADAVHRIWEAHEPRPYDGPLLLIRAGIRDEHAHLIDDDPYLGWRQLIRGSIALRSFDDTRHNEMLGAERAGQLAALLGPDLIGPDPIGPDHLGPPRTADASIGTSGPVPVRATDAETAAP